jgi:hypothetical protein
MIRQERGSNDERRSTTEHKDAGEVEWKDDNDVRVDGELEGGVGVFRRQPGRMRPLTLQQA